jgi:hypothetical protein
MLSDFAEGVATEACEFRLDGGCESRFTTGPATGLSEFRLLAVGEPVSCGPWSKYLLAHFLGLGLCAGSMAGISWLALELSDCRLSIAGSSAFINCEGL